MGNPIPAPKWLLLLWLAVESASAEYPIIGSLDSRDPLFVQLTQDIAGFHRAIARGEPLPELLLFHYSVDVEDDIYTIAAKTNLGLEAVASLNGLSGPKAISPGDDIILPNLPGVYVPANPQNDFEKILHAGRRGDSPMALRIQLMDGRRYVFYPDEKLSSIERAYFLDVLFRFPLREGTLSSGFGPRASPFTGNDSFHAGIDIAAPRGSDVIAARAGIVAAAGVDEELGNFVILDHGANYATVYGHLDTISVYLSQEVNSGTVIGRVGTTGLSTGPHLHFEVRAAGVRRNHLPLIRGTTE